eukprot:170657_1
MENPWDKFQHITCINLLEREDRYQRVTERFLKVGLDPKQIEFHRVHKSQFGAKYGCTESHLHVIKKYYQNEKIEYGIVFEDDIVFNKGWQNVLKDIITFITNADLNDWDILYLGGYILFPVEKSLIVPRIWNAKVGLAHAYIISRNGMKKMIEDCNVFDQEWMDTDNIWGDVMFLPQKYRPWFQCQVIPRFRKIYVHWIKLTMVIPYIYRPYIAPNLKFKASINRRNQNMTYIMLHPYKLFNIIRYVWLFVIVCVDIVKRLCCV